MRVAHLITRLIIGGAQENTLLNVEDQHQLFGDPVVLITGPGLGPEGSLEERASRGGFEFIVLPELRRELHPWHDMRAYRAIVRTLRRLQPELVHTHSSKAGILGRAAAAKLGIPAVHTVHGAAFHVGQHPVAHWAYRQAERWAAQRCEKIICVADAMTDQYVAAGIAPREKFVTIYSGMDVEPFLHPPRDPADVRQELGIAADDIVIGKVARLFHLKGHDAILEVAQHVVRANPRVRFLLVGDGILRPEIERRIADMGLTDRFVFTGLVPPARIPELIAAMDVVVHTSLWEGLARVLPQGLISGKPVVSFDVDGAREVVITGETGFLVAVGDFAKLAEALTTLAGDAELRQRFGETGRARLTDRFRHQEMTRRVRDVYSEVLERNVPIGKT